MRPGCRTLQGSMVRNQCKKTLLITYFENYGAVFWSVGEVILYDTYCEYTAPDMGAESGGGGSASPSREINGERPPINKDISATFFLTR